MLQLAKKYMSSTVKVQDFCLYVVCSVCSLLLSVFLLLLEILNAAIDYFVKFVPLSFVVSSSAHHPNASYVGVERPEATPVEKTLCALSQWMAVC